MYCSEIFIFVKTVALDQVPVGVQGTGRGELGVNLTVPVNNWL